MGRYTLIEGSPHVHLEYTLAHESEVRRIRSRAALVDGAFIGLLVAIELGCEFVYTLRSVASGGAAVFGVECRLPRILQQAVHAKTVVIVNGVINAGSAGRGTYDDLRANGAKIAPVGSLVVLGEEFGRFATAANLPIETLAHWTNQLWTAERCPLCVAGIPLERLAVN